MQMHNNISSPFSLHLWSSCALSAVANLTLWLHITLTLIPTPIPICLSLTLSIVTVRSKANWRITSQIPLRYRKRRHLQGNLHLQSEQMEKEHEEKGTTGKKCGGSNYNSMTFTIVIEKYKDGYGLRILHWGKNNFAKIDWKQYLIVK